MIQLAISMLINLTLLSSRKPSRHREPGNPLFTMGGTKAGILIREFISAFPSLGVVHDGGMIMFEAQMVVNVLAVMVAHVPFFGPVRNV